MTDSSEPNQDPNQLPPASGGTPSVNREVEGGIVLGEAFPLKDIGTHEINLPKEVIAVGVRQSPTNVTLPQAVAQLGMKASGQGQGGTQTPTIALPLTDDQIAQGLKVAMTNSWRWLAEWCIRKLKQLHKNIHKN